MATKEGGSDKAPFPERRDRRLVRRIEGLDELVGYDVVACIVRMDVLLRDVGQDQRLANESGMHVDELHAAKRATYTGDMSFRPCLPGSAILAAQSIVLSLPRRAPSTGTSKGLPVPSYGL